MYRLVVGCRRESACRRRANRAHLATSPHPAFERGRGVCHAQQSGSGLEIRQLVSIVDDMQPRDGRRECASACWATSACSQPYVVATVKEVFVGDSCWPRGLRACRCTSAVAELAHSSMQHPRDCRHSRSISFEEAKKIKKKRERMQAGRAISTCISSGRRVASTKIRILLSMGHAVQHRRSNASGSYLKIARISYTETRCGTDPVVLQASIAGRVGSTAPRCGAKRRAALPFGSSGCQTCA
eukprot:385321-Pleurochrysis_carterae.AAC.1